MKIETLESDECYLRPTIVIAPAVADHQLASSLPAPSAVDTAFRSCKLVSFSTAGSILHQPDNQRGVIDLLTIDPEPIGAT